MSFYVSDESGNFEDKRFCYVCNGSSSHAHLHAKTVASGFLLRRATFMLRLPSARLRLALKIHLG